MSSSNYFKIGEDFEDFIVKALYSRLNSNIRIIQNKRIWSFALNKYTQIDLILITDYGIYCIEAKRYRTRLKGSINDSVWLGYTGSYITRLYNPYLQNVEHIRCLKRHMRKLGCNVPSIKNYICIPNNCIGDTDLANVVTIGTLITRLERDCFRNRKSIDVEYFYNLINEI